MKTENAIFISVFVKADEVAVATNFDYVTAKDIMVQTLSRSYFDTQSDEALIFKADKSGVATPIFNYRAHLSQETDKYTPSPKQNKDVKLFFDCSICGGTDGRLSVDEDRDIIMTCKGCGTIIPVK